MELLFLGIRRLSVSSFIFFFINENFTFPLSGWVIYLFLYIPAAPWQDLGEAEFCQHLLDTL